MTSVLDPKVGSAWTIGGNCQVPISGTAVSRLTFTSTTNGPPALRAVSNASPRSPGSSTEIAAGAHRLRHRGEVGVPELAGRVLHEARPDLAVVHVEALEVADHADRVVVHDHPHGRDVVLDRGRHRAGEHHEAAVARHADGRPVGPRELDAEDAARAEAHAGEPARGEHRARLVGVPVLLDPRLVVAGVGDHQRVLRGGLAQLGDHAARVDRRLVRRLLGLDEVRPLLLPRLDLVDPRRALAGGLAAGELEQLLQHLAGVADDPELGRVVPADLLRVEVDVDQLGRRDVVRVARHPRRAVDVGEAAPDREDHVGVLRRLGGRVLAPAAGDPEVERVLRRQRALAHEGRVDRDVDVLGELAELLGRVRADHAAAREDQRPLRLHQHLECTGDRLGRAGRAPLEAERALLGLGHVDVGGADPEVVRHVDVHGAGAAGARELERLRQELAEVLDALRLEAPLRDHLRDRREVGLVVAVFLLERAGVVLVRRHLAGDRDERGRVVERVAHRDRQQHRAGPGRGVDGDHLAGGAEVRVGHVPGRGLDPREDDLDVVLMVVDAVEQADRPVPGVAEHVRDLLLDQVLDDEVAATHLGH